MSVQATSWVWDHSQSRLAHRLVLLAIADHAKADGTGAWPSVSTLAHEANISARQVKRALRELEAIGELTLSAGGPGGTHLYSLTRMVRGGDILTPPTPGEGVTSTTGGGDISGKEPGQDVTRTISTNHPEPSSSLVRPSVVERFFDAFWETYPRRSGKLKAREAFAKALGREGVTPVLILDGARSYRDDPNRDPTYTKLPATWLNQGCWEDDPLPARRSGGDDGIAQAIQRIQEDRRNA
jgi:hypothetical protein